MVLRSRKPFIFFTIAQKSEYVFKADIGNRSGQKKKFSGESWFSLLVWNRIVGSTIDRL